MGDVWCGSRTPGPESVQCLSVGEWPWKTGNGAAVAEMGAHTGPGRRRT